MIITPRLHYVELLESLLRLYGSFTVDSVAFEHTEIKGLHDVRDRVCTTKIAHGPEKLMRFSARSDAIQARLIYCHLSCRSSKIMQVWITRLVETS